MLLPTKRRKTSKYVYFTYSEKMQIFWSLIKWKNVRDFFTFWFIKCCSLSNYIIFQNNFIFTKTSTDCIDIEHWIVRLCYIPCIFSLTFIAKMQLLQKCLLVWTARLHPIAVDCVNRTVSTEHWSLRFQCGTSSLQFECILSHQVKVTKQKVSLNMTNLFSSSKIC